MENKPADDSSHLSDDLELLQRAAIKAGEIALQYFRADNKVWYKSGNSPVSEADKQVDAYLLKTLSSARADYGWLSEETEDDTNRLHKKHVFVVDPIDGTRGFIAGRPEWCISIAIVEANRPQTAVLHCPVLGKTFTAIAGFGAFENGIAISTAPDKSILSITGSKKVNEALGMLDESVVNIVDFVPSLAYRIAMVANGTIHAALAHGGASEWDLVAADLILCEAGGKLTDMKGNALRYNMPSVGMPSLIAASQSAYDPVRNLAKSNGILH